MRRDEYQTRITARDDATPVWNRAAGNAERAGSRMRRALAGAGGIGGGLAAGAGALMGGPLAMGGALLGGSLLGGAAAFASFGSAALREAGNIERMTATLAALSAETQEAAMQFDKLAATPLEAAAIQMGWLKRFATGALGEFKDLAEASIQLEAAGIFAPRVLPMLSNIAGAFGATREQVLSLAGAFGRLASGSSGEALERLREFGITRAAMEQAGIRFSGGGQMLSSVREAFEAIEEIAREKFGAIGRYMSGSWSQVTSNLADQWSQMLDSFGTAVLPVFKGLAQRASGFLSFLTDSNVAGGIGQRFAGGFQAAFGGDWLERGAMTVVAVFERLPQMIQSAWEAARRFATGLGDAFVSAYNFIGKAWTDLLNTFDRGLAGVVASLRAAVGQLLQGLSRVNILEWLTGQAPAQQTLRSVAQEFLAPTTPPQTRVFKPIESPGEAFGRAFRGTGTGNLFGDIARRRDELMAQFAGFQAQGGTAPAQGYGDFFNGSYIEAEQKELTRELRKNTRAVEKQTDVMDLRRQGFGGGELARLGATPAEVFGGTPQIRRMLNTHIRVIVGDALGGGNAFNPRAF